MPEKATGTTIPLFLQDAIARGLRYNLGLVELQHGDACALAALARADLVLMEAALRQQLLALHVNGRVLGAASSIGCSGVALRRL